MSAKIIDSRRYKTITKSQLEKKRRQNSIEINEHKKNKRRLNILMKKNKDLNSSNSTNINSYSSSNIDNSNSSTISNLRIKRHRERKLEREMLLYSRPQKTVLKEPKQKIYIPKSFIIACSVILGLIVLVIGIKVSKIDQVIASASESVFNNQEVEKIELENDYELKIALTSIDTTDIYGSSNLILNDMLKNSSLSLIKVTDNYDINYEVAKNITKISNTEYEITLNSDYKIDVDDLNASIGKFIQYGNSSMYFERIKNIKLVEQIGNDKYKCKITFKEDNPYMMYYLDFPLEDQEGKAKKRFSITVDEDGYIIFDRVDKDMYKNMKSVTFKNCPNIETSVDCFTAGEVSGFFATSNNDMQLIGKTDYNVKKYKDGETLFILGNKNSQVFSQKEVRTSLMYSLNREEIVKSSDNNFIEVIDLPFIYSSIKYKYDVVGAKNNMESNGWVRNGYGFFEKYSNTYLAASLNLIVNEADQDKLTVAYNIKNMAQNAGININVEPLSQEAIQERITSGQNWDIVLASVYLNETPDVTFIKDYLNINDTTAQAFTQVEQSSIEDLAKNIQNLEFVLSDEVACIGVYARNINLVYQKNIYGFENLNYMTIFKKLDQIGTLKE